MSDGRVVTRAGLLELGYTPKRITGAVARGEIVRLRRDRYAVTEVDPAWQAAARVGGLLTCVSALATTSAFIRHTSSRTHVHVERSMSRLRVPASVKLHWGPLLEPPAGLHSVSLIDALRQYARCGPEADVVATADSLVHQRLMTVGDVETAFAGLPRRLRDLARRIDGRPESGPESLLREMLRELGVAFEIQVRITGVGRVDAVVEGFLIIECDSKAFHQDWDQQRVDRQRDTAAARRGFFTLRLLAEDLLYRPERARASIVGLLDRYGIPHA